MLLAILLEQGQCKPSASVFPAIIYLRRRMLLAAEFSLSRLPFLALVLVEPTMVTRELFSVNIDDRLNAMNVSVSATSTRRDTWDSREAAFNWFKKRLPWKVWDPRVIRLLSVCLLLWLRFLMLNSSIRNMVCKRPQLVLFLNAVRNKKPSHIGIQNLSLTLRCCSVAFLGPFLFMSYGVVPGANYCEAKSQSTLLFLPLTNRNSGPSS